MRSKVVSMMILGFSIVNMILLIVIIVAVVPTNLKAVKFMDMVATSVSIEKGNSTGVVDNSVDVDSLKVLNFDEELIINLRPDENGKQHFAKLKVALTLNTKPKSFKKLEQPIVDSASIISEIVSDEFSRYTNTEVLENRDKIKDNILAKIKDFFKDSENVITGVTIANLVVQ